MFQKNFFIAFDGNLFSDTILNLHIFYPRFFSFHVTQDGSSISVPAPSFKTKLFTSFLSELKFDKEFIHSCPERIQI